MGHPSFRGWLGENRQRQRQWLRLTDYLEDAVPAGEVGEGVYDLRVFATGGGSCQCGRISAAKLQREVDKEGLADDVLAGDKAPVAAVLAVVAIVSEDEVVAGGGD